VAGFLDGGLAHSGQQPLELPERLVRQGLSLALRPGLGGPLGPGTPVVERGATGQTPRMRAMPEAESPATSVSLLATMKSVTKRLAFSAPALGLLPATTVTPDENPVGRCPLVVHADPSRP
jgi:hypothetical protein